MARSGWYTVRSECVNRVTGRQSPLTRYLAGPSSTGSEAGEVLKSEFALEGDPLMPQFDVLTVVRVRIECPDVNQAEDAVLELLERLAADAFDTPGMIETGFDLSLESPVSVGVQRERT